MSSSPHPSNSSYPQLTVSQSSDSSSTQSSIISTNGSVHTPILPSKSTAQNKGKTFHVEDDTDTLVDSLKEEQKHSLILKYAESSPIFEQELDQLLKKFAKKDHHVLLDFMKQINSRGKYASLLGGGSKVDPNIANQSVILEYRKFWYEENRTEGIDHESKDEQDVLRKLASYVPKLVVRRFVNNTSPVKPGEIEHYPACVVFADVSGFTALTDKLASLGPEGVEKLTHHLNTYFDSLIGTIYRYGGDIVKFAGDAILCVWPAASPKGLGGMIMLACQCAKNLLHDLNDYKVPETDCVLRLHIGVGAGEIGGVHVGGVRNRTEFFISGQVLEQVSYCEKQAQPGEVYVSAVAWLLVESGSLIGVQKGSGGALANYRLDGIKTPLDLPPPITLPLYKDMEESIRTYIPPAVLRHISSDTKRWLAQLRNVSVIFLNLTSPFKEEKVQDLQTAIAEMQQIIDKYEGVLRQFMIDDKGSVLIVGFGLPPLSHEDDPQRAVEAALDLYASLQQLKVPCSIGVTSGKAFCGDVGSSQRREYAMVGDIVNLSARLMAAAKTGILCDSDTYEAVKNAETIIFEEQKPIKVKGKPNPIVTYIPKRNKKAASTLTQSLRNKNLRATIGRDSELKMVHKYIKSLADNYNAGFLESASNPCLIIEGEAGVGKTRLVFEAQIAAQKQNLKLFTATGNQLQSSTPYHAWQTMFEALYPDNKIPENVLNSVSAYTEYLSLLSSVLPLNIEETPKVKSMNPEERSEIMHQMLIKILQTVVKRGSVIILENSQWFDSNSWAVALAVITQLLGIFVIISIRPIREGVPFQFSQIKNRKKTKIVQLRNLPEDKTEEFIGSILQIKKIPENIVKDIHRKSQGNPFVTEAIVNGLRDNGSIQISKNGECVISGDATSVIPNNLAGLLTSKVDRLTPNQQVLLRVASVIGQTFSFEMLGEILFASKGDTSRTMMLPAEIKKDLKAIENAGLLGIESPEPNLEYCFANSLIRDVVYDLMLYSQKRQVHRHIVQFYREHFEGRSAYYPLIAYHLKQAEEYETALEYFIKAGDTCRLNYANKEAVTFFTEALNLVNKLNQAKSFDAVSLERKLGQAFYSVGQIEQAGSQFQKVLELVGLPLDDSKKIKTLMTKGLATHNYSSDKKDDVASEKQFRKREAIIALLGLTRVSIYQCNKFLATQCGQLALMISDDAGPALCSESYAVNTFLCGINNDNENAEAYIKKGLEVAGKHLDMIKDVEQMAGLYYINIGKWEDAEKKFMRAIELAKTVGNLKSLEESSVFIGTIQFLKGDLQKSINNTQQAIESSSRGDAQIQMLATNAQARNYYAVGDFAKCLECLKDVKVAFDSVGMHDSSAEINFYAMNALMYLRRKEIQQCWIFSETVFNIMSKIEPTAFFTFVGYCILPEIYIRILHEQKFKDNDFTISRGEVQKKAEKSLNFLEKFASVFTFAQPRLRLWTGAYRYISGKNNKAEQEWALASSAAKSLGLVYEEAFVTFMKGVITKNGDEIVAACNKVPEIKSLGFDITTIKLKLIKL